MLSRRAHLGPYLDARYLILLGGLAFCSTAAAASNPPTIAWTATYDDTFGGNDQVTAMTHDSAGNIYVTGYSSGSSWDIATVKYSPTGRQLHLVRYNGPAGGDDVPRGIAADESGNVYVAGYTDGNGQYNYDLLVVKYDSTLTQQWTRTYAGNLNVDADEATAVAIAPGGDVCVTGFSFEAPTQFDCVTLRYTPAGVRSWVRRYDGPGHAGDEGDAIAVDADGNVYVTGTSAQTTETANRDIVTLKYGPTGTQEWVQYHPGAATGPDGGLAIALDAAADVHVAGFESGAGSPFDFSILKYSSAGDLAWAKTVDGPGHSYDAALALALDGDANVYATGYVTSTHGDADYGTVKYDTAGVRQWLSTNDGPVQGYDEGQAIAVDAAGNSYITGYSDGGTSVVNYDYATVKYDSQGIEQWHVRYDGPGDNIDVAEAIFLDSQNRVVISGWSTGGAPGTDVDFATIVYQQDGAALVPELGSITWLSSVEAVPNPFGPATTLRFALPKEADIAIDLFAADGRMLVSRAREHLPAGDHAFKIDGSTLPSGVCFYRLSAGCQSTTGRLLHIR